MEIRDKDGVKLALLLSMSEISSGLTFFSENQDYHQVSSVDGNPALLFHMYLFPKKTGISTSVESPIGKLCRISLRLFTNSILLKSYCR